MYFRNALSLSHGMFCSVTASTTSGLGYIYVSMRRIGTCGDFVLHCVFGINRLSWNLETTYMVFGRGYCY